ncbi:MAG: outer membrane lipoprotein LolB [Nitrosomonadales bacterium]|nr:outer membrane lipoprotein LolB [Nitrosomonadales bacterium]
MMRLLLVLGLAMLSGCASLQPAQAPTVRPSHPETAPFEMSGRVSINHQGERHTAGLHWTHRAQSDEILLLTPLGQTVARIYRDDSHATLDDGKQRYQDADVESLMQQVLGWHLPLAGLHQWVLGLPVADVPAQTERGGDGRVSLLYQDGWEVRYLRFADSQPDSLPSRLQLNRENLQMQLLIDEWAWIDQVMH